MVLHINASLKKHDSADEGAETQLLTIGEVAQRLRVDPSTVRRWITAGALAAIVLPRPGTRQAYRVKQSVLDALLKKNE